VYCCSYFSDKTGCAPLHACWQAMLVDMPDSSSDSSNTETSTQTRSNRTDSMNRPSVCTTGHNFDNTLVYTQGLPHHHRPTVTEVMQPGELKQNVRPNLTSSTRLFAGSDMPTKTDKTYWSSGATLARCPCCHHQWLIWIPARVEPRFAGCKFVTLATESRLLLNQNKGNVKFGTADEVKNCG